MILYIAEIGLNHNGELSLAKEMVDAAKESGTSAVKFQSINAMKLIAKNAMDNKIDGFGFNNVNTVGEFWDKVGVDKAFHYEIKKYCDQKDIEFISTPFDFLSVDLLDELGIRRFKVASGDLTHYPLLKKIARKSKPIILSTGMASIDEIDNVVLYCKDNDVKDLTLLHCLSLYPTRPELANLNAISFLKERYRLPVGFSDHTIGSHISVSAIALGATIIEKHFTIDNNLPGPDQKLSANPEIFKRMVKEGNDVFKAIQQKGKIVTLGEIKMKEFARRSIVAALDIQKGEILMGNKLEYKRPGTGIGPNLVNQVIGRVVAVDIKMDAQIMESDLKTQVFSKD